jgi:hypothetical protein
MAKVVPASKRTNRKSGLKVRLEHTSQTSVREVVESQRVDNVGAVPFPNHQTVSKIISDNIQYVFVHFQFLVKIKEKLGTNNKFCIGMILDWCWSVTNKHIL